jgi:hypothetical protein
VPDLSSEKERGFSENRLNEPPENGRLGTIAGSPPGAARYMLHRPVRPWRRNEWRIARTRCSPHA